MLWEQLTIVRERQGSLCVSESADSLVPHLVCSQIGAGTQQVAIIPVSRLMAKDVLYFITWYPADA